MRTELIWSAPLFFQHPLRFHCPNHFTPNLPELLHRQHFYFPQKLENTGQVFTLKNMNKDVLLSNTVSSSWMQHFFLPQVMLYNHIQSQSFHKRALHCHPFYTSPSQAPKKKRCITWKLLHVVYQKQKIPSVVLLLRVFFIINPKPPKKTSKYVVKKHAKSQMFKVRKHQAPFLCRQKYIEASLTLKRDSVIH